MVSAHRTPERLFHYGHEAEGRGLEVLIAGAGGAAHLPGMLAAISMLPVLGVPVESKILRGVDSLLSIVQMPRGVPVGTLAIGSSGSRQRRHTGRGDPGKEVSRDPCGRCPAPPGSDRGRGRIAGMSMRPDRSHLNETVPLVPPASLGVIGSGQLGRMFIQAAQRMGYRAGVFSDAEDRPAAQVAHWTVIGRDDDVHALRAFADRAEAVTVEFENVSAPALRWLARRRPVRPGWRTLWVAQNRLREKSFLARNGIPHAPWRPGPVRVRAR